MKSVLLMPVIGLLAVCPGCSTPGRPMSAKIPDPVKIVIPEPKVIDGSLWQENGTVTASLTSDLKARAKGDLVTVVVLEKVDAKRTRNTTTSKEQNVDGSVTDVTLPLIGPVLGATATAKVIAGINDKTTVQNTQTTVDATRTARTARAVNAAAGNRDFSVGLKSKRDFTGKGEVTDTGEVTATITTQVVNVLPNGNLILMGTKEVSVSGEVQIVTLTGIARPRDITPGNTIDSTLLAEARVYITGSGPLDDSQRRTLVSRVLDWVNLF